MMHKKYIFNIIFSINNNKITLLLLKNERNSRSIEC